MSVYKFCYKVVNTGELKGKPHPPPHPLHAFCQVSENFSLCTTVLPIYTSCERGMGGGGVCVYVCVSVLHGRGLSMGEPTPLESENSIPTIKPPYLLLGV